MSGYARPEVLVDTSWVQAHAGDRGVRIVEVDVDTYSFEEAHVPGAIAWDWTKQLSDPRRRDILSKDDFEALMRSSGVANDTTVILYGDNNNWFAAWAFWQLKMFGHDDVRLMNGGRRKWLEEGRAVSLEPTAVAACAYEAKPPDASQRAFLADVLSASARRAASLVDVRSPAEFRGEILAPPGLPEGCQRGGHIPGAVNVPWGLVCADDGTFKSFDELARLFASVGVAGDRPAIAYCRIGERSSHTWFVLKYLLGFADVRNYDGSWTEYGNLVNVPIAIGSGRGDEAR